MTDHDKERDAEQPSYAQIGDSVSADGKAGIVVDFDDGKPVILPFRDEPHYLKTEPFTAQGNVKVNRKHFERESPDLER